MIRALRARLALAATAAGLGALGTGCAFAPPARIETELVTVRAQDPETARRVAELASRWIVELRAELPATHGDRVEVWVQKRPSYWLLAPPAADIVAFHVHATGRIHLGSESTSLQHDLAHELVHALVDERWDDVPPALMEGLCDQMAKRRSGAVDEQRRLVHLSRLLFADAALGGRTVSLEIRDARGTRRSLLLHFEDLPAIPIESVLTAGLDMVGGGSAAREKAPLYGLGYLLMERFFRNEGITRVRRALASGEESPQAALLSAVIDSFELPDEVKEWRGPLQADLARELEPHLALIAVVGHEGLLDCILEHERQESAGGQARALDLGPGTVAERIAHAEPKLRIEGGSTEIALMAVPEFVELLAERSEQLASGAAADG
jgi:hypothetical protein